MSIERYCNWCLRWGRVLKPFAPCEHCGRRPVNEPDARHIVGNAPRLFMPGSGLVIAGVAGLLCWVVIITAAVGLYRSYQRWVNAGIAEVEASVLDRERQASR